MPTPRGDLRRQQIVEAALAEIRTQAVADVQLSAIAERAGMKASHVLYYFGSRDDVLIAAVAHAEQQLATDRAERLRAIDDPDGAARRLRRHYLPDDRHDPVWKLWIEGWLRSPSRTEFAPIGRKAERAGWPTSLDCLAHVTARGGALPEPAPSFARRFLFLLDGLAVHVLADHIDIADATGFAMASLRSELG